MLLEWLFEWHGIIGWWNGRSNLWCWHGRFCGGMEGTPFGGGMEGAPFGGGLGGAPFGGGIGGMEASMGGGSFSSMLAPTCGVNNGATSDGGMGSYMSNEEVSEDGDVNNGGEDNT
jgi:hypothetical protein